MRRNAFAIKSFLSVGAALFFCSIQCVSQELASTIELMAYKANATAELGTAFFIDAQGTAVTCYHVIEHSVKIDAFPSDRHHIPVNVLAIDATHDLAVVQIVAEGSTHSFLPTKQLPSRLTNEDLKAYGLLNGMPDSIVHVRSTHDTMVKTSSILDAGQTVFALSDIDVISLDGLVYAAFVPESGKAQSRGRITGKQSRRVTRCPVRSLFLRI
jgi:Trypsin-like peptidase domain